MKSEKPKQKRSVLPLVDRFHREVKEKYFDERNMENAVFLMEFNEQIKKYKNLYTVAGTPDTVTMVVKGKEPPIA